MKYSLKETLKLANLVAKQVQHDKLCLYFTNILLSFFFIILLQSNSFGQLSPGKLSKPHSNLEGLSNCTNCHSIGNKISNQKCLDCHKYLNSRVTQKKGFHISSQVKNKECITCHSEHHGLNFEMVRFDKKTFNHTLTGYELKGAHKTKVKSCDECHKPENISNNSLKKNPKTFLGLDTKCLTCHEDFHQNTLSSDCAKCHTFDNFKPASLFNHNKTKFALAGAHKEVKCVECHKSALKNGKDFTQYSGVEFNSCASCHKDVHKGQFGSICSSCHSEESFHKINPSKNFNHNVTGFTLEGKHKEINCKKCHDNPNGSFQEFSKINNLSCVSCHKDIHEGKFGNDCKSCHNQNSFLIKNSSILEKFDHGKTAYPLEGKHETVDCRTCHKESLTTALPHDKCMSCHDDKHNGDFTKKNNIYPDCASCHKVSGFSPSLYTAEKHNENSFKLEGAHYAQPCFSCHYTSDKKWVFSNLGKNCIDCHTDIHNDFIDQKFYGNSSCVTCHSTESWQKVSFDHDKTNYPLTGGHSKAKCGDCHFKKINNKIEQKFKSLPNQCASCHVDVHGKQFEIKGVTDCKRCHETKVWDSSSFNHDKTKFKLDGEHKVVSCNACHNLTLKDDKNIRSFKLEKFRCVDCHL